MLLRPFLVQCDIFVVNITEFQQLPGFLIASCIFQELMIFYVIMFYVAIWVLSILGTVTTFKLLKMCVCSFQLECPSFHFSIYPIARFQITSFQHPPKQMRRTPDRLEAPPCTSRWCRLFPCVDSTTATEFWRPTLSGFRVPALLPMPLIVPTRYLPLSIHIRIYPD